MKPDGINPDVVKQVLREDGITVDNLSDLKEKLNSIVKLNNIITSDPKVKITINKAFDELKLYGIKNAEDAANFMNRINAAEKEAFVRMDEASRLSAMFKRTMIGGSTRHNLQPQDFGTDEYVTIACSKDLRAPVSDILGTVLSEYAQDGAGFAHPAMTVLENWSYMDAALGKSRKTIWGYVDPETGQMHEIKWAVFTLTNELRQNSMMNDDYSYENAYRKMSNKLLGTTVQLERFWNKTQTSYSSRRGWNKKRLTLSNDIYRYDYTTNTYYRLVDARTDEFGVGVTNWEQVVVDNGIIKVVNTDVPPLKRSIETLYDIDYLFGGAFIYEWNDDQKSFVQTDANATIIANVLCEYDIKDKLVGYLVPQQAMKVSVRNRNDNELFNPGNTEDLSTFVIRLIHGGGQMDVEHDVEGGDVAEMMQTIAALGQNGYLTTETLDVYNIIGQTIRESIPEFRKAIKDGDINKIDNLLGRLLIDSFNKDNSQDRLGLAGAFVRKAEQLISANKSADVDIPFSASSIKGKFLAETVTKINKAIKRRCPGLGTVQAPGYKTMSHCMFNGQVVSFKRLSQILNEPIIDARGRKSKSLAEQVDDIIPDLSEGSAIKYRQFGDKVTNLLKNQLIDKSGRIRNPLIKPLFEIGRKQLTIEDTVVVRKKGSLGEGKVIQIKDARELDLFQNLIDLSQFEIYKWDGKPRELRAALTEIEFYPENLSENGITTTKLSLQQLDVNRALFYIFEIEDSGSYKVRGFKYENFVDGIAALELSSIEKRKKINLIRKVINDYAELSAFKDMDDETLISNLSILRPALESLSQKINTGLSDVFRKKGEFVLPRQDAMMSPLYVNRNSTIAVKSVSTKPPQIILGRAYAKLLGIKPTDNVWDITGPGYFKKNLKALEALPPKTVVPENVYDCMLLTEDGRKILVTIGNATEKDDILNQTRVISGNKAFSKYRGNLTLNGEDVCDSDGIDVYTYTSENGVFDLIRVDDVDTFHNLYDSGYFTTVKYNYTVDNYLDLLEMQGLLKNDFLDSFEIDDLLVSEDFVTDKYNLDNISRIILKQPDEAVKSLIQLEREQANKRIEKLANKRWESYVETMRFIGARIPTQSQQSFSSAEIVMFADIETNECWLPRVVTWIEGSDYKSIL